MLRQLGFNSAVYAVTYLVQRGAAFLLMPLYTLYLDPSAYGVLAIVTAINGLLAILFTLGLTGAVTRFYFEYQDAPERLAEFWGTIVTFVLLTSLVLGGMLLLVGDRVLRPLIGDVPLWPYVALGVLTTFFQPFFTTFLAVLQTRNQAARFSFMSIAHFALTTVLTIALVVLLEWGVTGALVATLAATAVFFVVALWLMRAELRFTLKLRYLRPALAYGLPQVPHSLAGHTTAIADRLILNSRLGAATTGVYSVGAMIAMVVEVASHSVNRAYVPLAMAALKTRTPADLQHLRSIGSLIVAGFCLLGAGVGAFARELVWLLTAPSFAGAELVVPVLAFSGVAYAIYYLFVNVLFFDRSAIRLLPIGTLTAAALNIGLALALVPRFGLIGAAASTLLAHSATATLTAVIARRFEPVTWDYGRYAVAFICGLASAIWLSSFSAGGALLIVLAKLAGLAALAVVLGLVLWRRPLILADAAVRLLRRRPAEAAALFSGKAVS
jgi:O-antigen/teichoic acid export membrane protein